MNCSSPDRSESFEPLFMNIAAAGFDAVFLVPSPLVDANQALVGKLSRTIRLPTVSGGVGFCEAGGLLGFAVNYDYNLRRTAGYVDQILRRANPALLLVEEPSDFSLTLNLATAKALGLTVPHTLLLRATRVIESQFLDRPLLAALGLIGTARSISHGSRSSAAVIDPNWTFPFRRTLNARA